MRVERRRGGQVSHERWLVSYADFVTLLFAFFVVLYASAQVDRQRALQLSDAIRSGFRQLGVFQGEKKAAEGVLIRDGANSGTTPDFYQPQRLEGNTATPGTAAEFINIRSELERALAPQIERKEVVLHLEPDGLVVTLREIGFFETGSAAMKPGAEKAFAQIAAILRAHACAVRIEGHTDNVPIHNSQFASNWELSTTRATGLVRSLVDNFGLSPALLSAAGYAEFHPASPNDTSHGRALNRRVDLVILRSAKGGALRLPFSAKTSSQDPNPSPVPSLEHDGQMGHAIPLQPRAPIER